eukprot:NODE_507_length_1513_cov_6.775034.p2 GENE.NODE_507_length_1513_cov_6.775034~~NODE_507_length_1513_cov_6.775034.p2  ORF type:complete len:176 (+),score=22.58 NODE_507_length_1513_cov_6.775034:600-1127(+)
MIDNKVATLKKEQLIDDEKKAGCTRNPVAAVVFDSCLPCARETRCLPAAPTLPEVLKRLGDHVSSQTRQAAVQLLEQGRQLSNPAPGHLSKLTHLARPSLTAAQMPDYDSCLPCAPERRCLPAASTLPELLKQLGDHAAQVLARKHSRFARHLQQAPGSNTMAELIVFTGKEAAS